MLTALFTMLLAVVVAIEPSNVIITKDGKSYYKHLVEKGHTLYSLSKAYNVTEQQIIDCNEGLTAATLKLGDYVLIPKLEVEKEQRALKASKGNKGDGKFIVLEVKAGNTIYSIARKYKISVEVLERDNPSIDVEHIAVGDKIKVRRSESGYATTEDIERERSERESRGELGADEHRVVAGETVYSLSRAYDIPESEFMRINGMDSTKDLKVGMVVKTRSQMYADEQSEQPTISDEKPADIEEANSEDESALAPIDSFAGEGAIEDIHPTPVEVEFTPLGSFHTLKVALMLPFHHKGRVNPYYVDFYRGVLLAMEELKAEGKTIELSVFDTCGDSERISDIVTYEQEFIDAQLIIGPVYDGELRYVLSHAEQNEVPVVSPLADIEGLRSPVLFQMQAEGNHKYSKLESLFEGDREVVTIYAGEVEQGFTSEIEPLLAGAKRSNFNFVFDRGSFFYSRNADGSNGASVDIIELMRSPVSKAFVIAAANETDVDRILTTLSSTKAAIVGKGMTYGDYLVVGNRKWKQSANIDHQSFFRNNTIFVVPYHANRSNDKIRLFDARFVEAFGVLPSMYSYRGYDAAMIFCRKMFTGIDATLYDETFTPLATTYRFSFEDGHYVNTEWMREQYKGNFRIEVE